MDAVERAVIEHRAMKRSEIEEGEECLGCGRKFQRMNLHLARRQSCREHVLGIVDVEDKAMKDAACCDAAENAFKTVMRSTVARELADFRFGRGHSNVVPGTALDGVKERVASWLASSEASLVAALEPHISPESGVDVRQLINSRLDIFNGIDSAKLEEKELIQGALGSRWVAPRKRMMPGSDKDCVWDFPLIEQLQALIAYDRSAAEQILASSTSWASMASSPPPQHDRVRSDIPHGDIFMKHAKLGATAGPLPCMVSGAAGVGSAWKMYYDDVEVTNPLGVARGVHAIGAIYVSLINLDPATRNRIEYIFLATLALTSVIKKYGMLAVIAGAHLDGSIDDNAEFSLGGQMRLLDAGVVLRYPANGSFGGAVERTTYGWMLMSCADYPAAAKLLGTAGSTSAKRPCRGCDWEKDNKLAFAKSSFLERPGVRSRWKLRTLEQAQDAIDEAKLLTSKKAADEVMKEAGMYAAIFAFHPDYFPHCPDPFKASPQDGMHSLYSSGLVDSTYAKVLYMLISIHREFTLDTLNQALDNLVVPAGVRLPPLHESVTAGAAGGIPSPNAKLRYTGSQTMHFALHSRALIEPLLSDKSHPSWKVLLALVDVVERYNAHSFTLAAISDLDDAITKYIQLYRKVPQFKDQMRPKHHFLTHTAVDIINFGPPRFFWCFGYEAKNQEVKRAAASSNFKDVIKSASKILALQSAKSIMDRG